VPCATMPVYLHDCLTSRGDTDTRFVHELILGRRGAWGREESGLATIPLTQKDTLAIPASLDLLLWSCPESKPAHKMRLNCGDSAKLRETTAA
jgi:hypothetical protein